MDRQTWEAVLGAPSLKGKTKTLAILGGQWGDEGKGKMVDLLASWADFVARGTGGANAGHTIRVGEKEIVLHLVPSGILHDAQGTINICGSGMAIDPMALCNEIGLLRLANQTFDNLKVAHNATLVLPQHIVLDRVKERAAGGGKIGTTGRGIGPAYTDKVARVGMTVNDLLNPDSFREKFKRNLAQATRLLNSFNLKVVHEVMEETEGFGMPRMDNQEKVAAQYLVCGEALKDFITDTDKILRSNVGNKNILLEGAQGFLLGINDGTYPFVTSSDCSVGGLARGVGLDESDVDQCLVVAKAFYMTRVGAGPFPTELGGEDSARDCNQVGTTRETEADRYPDATVNSADPYEQGVGIRQAGWEYGATTKRPRRTGWLDLPLLRYVVGRCINASLILTKLDVLDDCREIQVCTDYAYEGPDYRLGDRVFKKGDEIRMAVVDETVFRHSVPVYKLVPGWESSTSACRTQEALPHLLKNLIELVEEEVGPVKIVSVGPERDQIVIWP